MFRMIISRKSNYKKLLLMAASEFWNEQQNEHEERFGSGRHSTHFSTHSADVNEPKIQFFKSACEEFAINNLRLAPITKMGKKKKILGKSKSEKLWQGRTTPTFVFRRRQNCKGQQKQRPERKKPASASKMRIRCGLFFLLPTT